MKRKIVAACLAAIALAPQKARSESPIVVDPAMMGTIIAQTAVLDEQYTKRNKLQTAILEAQGAIFAATEELHRVEKKVLGYMSEVQAGIRDLKMIADIIELTTKIPAKVGKLAGAVPDNIKGTAIAAYVSQCPLRIISEVTTLAAFIEPLVTSGSIVESNSDGKKEEKKVNLLNSGERFRVLGEVHYRLRCINSDLETLYWQVRSYELRDLLYKLDPKTFNAVYLSKFILEDSKREWDRLVSRVGGR